MDLLLLDQLEVLVYLEELVLFPLAAYQSNGKAAVAVPPAAPDSVQIVVRAVGDVEVDDHVNRTDINSTRVQICRYKNARRSLREVVEDLRTFFQIHPRMHVERRDL